MSSTQVIMGPINVTSSHTTIRGTTEVISTLCVVMLNTTTFPGNRALDPSVLVTTLPGNGTLDLSVCWPATTSSPNWGISLNTSGRKHFFWVITCSILVGLLNTWDFSCQNSVLHFHEAVYTSDDQFLPCQFTACFLKIRNTLFFIVKRTNLIRTAKLKPPEK